MDEEDLTKKYENKPEQLANILAHTRTMMCPVRRVKLFEDLKFTSETVDEESRAEARKRKVEMAPKKSPKGKAKGKSKEEPDVDKVKLKAGEKKNSTRKVRQ